MTDRIGKYRFGMMIAVWMTAGLLWNPLRGGDAPDESAAEPAAAPVDEPGAEPAVNLLDDAQYEAQLESVSGDVRQRVQTMRDLRNARALREAELRRSDPDAAAILEEIDELQAEIQKRLETLQAVFGRDEEWTRLNRKDAEEEAAMHAARGAVIQVIQARKRLEFEQRRKEMERDGTVPAPLSGAEPAPVRTLPPGLAAPPAPPADDAPATPE